MSSGMPELGSKISLISKADIRYEGRLFTVDPQECTIALSNVRSFGTEDREASFPVAPQSQIYDYILFRGSDIKDIRVVHSVNQIPNDPAIVTLSVPPPLANSGFQQQQQSPQQQQQQGGFSHGGMLGHIGSGVSQFGSYSSMGGVPSGLAPGMGVPSRIAQESRTLSSELADSMQGPPPPLEPQQAHPPPPQPIAAESADLISGRSGNATPVGSGARKSPTIDQGTQAGKPSGVVGSNRMMPGRGGAGGPMGGDQRDFRNNRAPGNNRQQQQGGWHDNAWGQGRGQMHQQQQHHQQQHQQQQHDGWGPQQQGSRGGWRGGPRRGRGRGGNFMRPPGAPPQLMGLGQQQPIGPPHPNQQQQNQAGAQKKNVLKFEGDYDFEQANTEFENLRAQLANIKLTATAAGQLSGAAAGGAAAAAVPGASSAEAATPAATAAKVNGEEKKEVDSGNETGAGEGEAEEESETYYDKTKSFFDNISCEAIERSKGCSQRTDWRQERKLNSETFGVSSARRGYRGRGGYYRGGGMYRGGGGYRGGFRGRGGYNRHPGQQQHQQQHQGQQGYQGGPPQGGGNRATATAGGK